MITGHTSPYGRWWSVEGHNERLIAELFLSWALTTPPR